MVKTIDQVVHSVHLYVTELESLGIPVERVVLFGSYARASVHDDSDIDLAVFSPAFGREDHLEFSGVLSKAKWNSDTSIEAIGFNPAALVTAGPASFLAEIVRTGRVAYQRQAAGAGL
jgi:uncharacterized protein